MLSCEDNEKLVRVGKGTPMGELFRRFWTPALLASEVAQRDGAPVRVNILGEELVAFRDSEGRVGLLDAFCPHRRANLFWGRNEECGLRCVYHGWKFNVDGDCVDLPNVPAGDILKINMRTQAYPTLERGGIVWAYLGPPELQPKPSAAEVFDLPSEHLYIQKMMLRGNWLQHMEGDIDSSHVSFLHGSNRGGNPSGVPISPLMFADKAPKWTIRETEYGLMLAARRSAGDDSTSWYWRVNQWLMPYATQIAPSEDSFFITNVRVPIDDEASIHFRIMARHDRPLNEADRAVIAAGVAFPEMTPGTFEPKARPENDFLVDRELQRTASFTGIRSIPSQDYAVTHRPGGLWIADRSKEKLTRSDMAIVAMRRRLLDALKEMAEGREPPEASRPQAYRVRSINTILPREVDVVEGTKDWAAAALV
jgi:phenylpropionate dioxygenase-like ring-hydroxylating dioxygenase large terminal subunit